VPIRNCHDGSSLAYNLPVVTTIGHISLAAPLCQAGLAGYSDRAMRLVARRRGCPYAVTEALLDTILLSGGLGLKKSIDINDEDHPCAGQIMGAEPETMAPAARLLQQAGYDVIDLNFACPVKKIKNKSRGGHMLKDVPRALALLGAVRDAVPPHVPTTVSLRRGFGPDVTSRQADPRGCDLFRTVLTGARAFVTLRAKARTSRAATSRTATSPVLACRGRGGRAPR